MSKHIEMPDIDIGEGIDSVSFKKNGYEIALVCTSRGVYEITSPARHVSREQKHKHKQCKIQSPTHKQLLSLDVRDPLWTLQKRNDGYVVISNGYDRYQYGQADVGDLMEITAEISPKTGHHPHNSNEVTYRSRFYTVICQNVSEKNETIVRVVHNDVDDSHLDRNREMPALVLNDTKILQIVPASQGRYLLFGTKVAIVKISTSSTATRNFEVSLLEASMAPQLPLAVGGHLELENVVIQCPYASTSRETKVRIPLPHCLS